MKRLHHISLNVAIACNGMLLLWCFYSGPLRIPAWLQVGGRLHPLLLHFPIAVVMLLAGYSLWFALRNKNTLGLHHWVSAAATLTACTALSGMLLSNEPGYDAAALYWHQSTGAALSIALLLWALWYRQLQSPWLQGVCSTVIIVLLVLAGHQGASYTHGADFLLQPIAPKEKNTAVHPDYALVFEDLVKPILQEKCMACHQESKAKGGLLMTSQANLIKGGKSGKLWDLQAPGFGLMMQRIHLPTDDKKHMPPVSRPQLTATEILILERWLVNGADFKLAVAALPPTDTLALLAKSRWESSQQQAYTFDAAPAATVAALNTTNRQVYPVAMNSPALEVAFFGPSMFSTSQLKELEPIKQQVVSINLNKMPVQDSDLPLLAGFDHLQRLNVSFGAINGEGLPALAPLKKLQQLSLSGTRINSRHIKALKSLPALQRLYAWNTGIRPEEYPEVEAALKPIKVFWGFRGDTIRMPLNAPILENTEQILVSPVMLKLRHFLPGVDIRYTLDGSDPDSLKSPSYAPGVIISEAATLKAKAFKAGWLSSDVTTRYFFKKQRIPGAVKALTEPDDFYKKFGAAVVNDHVKGDKNFRSGAWLGFRQQNLDMLLYFEHHTTVKAVTVSGLVDIASYIMPPTAIEVWGGPDEKHLKRLASLSPRQPSENAPAYLDAYTLRFDQQTVQCLRIMAKPVRSLPDWHAGKGDKGWVFVDEFFVE